MLKSPAMINSLLQSPKDAATDDNCVIQAFTCSFSIFGGLYITLYIIFPVVKVLTNYHHLVLLLILTSVHVN